MFSHTQGFIFLIVLNFRMRSKCRFNFMKSCHINLTHIHLHLFKQVLPKKPKPHRINTLTTAAFGGWTIIRDAVLQQFGQTCKDTEYMLLLHLFDEVLPLVFYFYCTIFRGGDFDKWLAATFRMALVFITFKRRNYDKATLCQLSDILYHAAENQPLVDNIKLYLNAFTEKKVEVFHSVLRRFVQTILFQTNDLF